MSETIAHDRRRSMLRTDAANALWEISMGV